MIGLCGHMVTSRTTKAGECPYVILLPFRLSVMLNNAGDAGDGFIQDAAAAYPLIGSGGWRN